MGASKPETFAPKGFDRSSIQFATIPVASGIAPVKCVMCDGAVSDGVGGRERRAARPRAAIAR